MDHGVYRRPRGATIDPSNGQGTRSKGLRLGQRRGPWRPNSRPHYSLRPRAEGATFRAMTKRPLLKGWSIALSVSDSPDLSVLGLNERHLRDGMVAVAGCFLAAGATLLYGGDLRALGFTELLFELAAGYRSETEGRRRAVANLLAWPVHIALSQEELERRRNRLGASGSLVCLSPDGAVMSHQERASLASKGPSDHEWTQGLTSMRRTLAHWCDAHVLLGGQTQRFRGKMPGIAQEALLTLEAGKPVFLIGGFGGCTRNIAETMMLPERPHRRPLERVRVHDLGNGLTAAEAATLAQTADTDEIITLILRGLQRRQTLG